MPKQTPGARDPSRIAKDSLHEHAVDVLDEWLASHEGAPPRWHGLGSAIDDEYRWDPINELARRYLYCHALRVAQDDAAERGEGRAVMVDATALDGAFNGEVIAVAEGGSVATSDAPGTVRGGAVFAGGVALGHCILRLDDSRYLVELLDPGDRPSLG